ncbi:substrate-binding periplasmic protein [Shewanella salipaludis]|nr:transporter substrate-binding domain-containing protein [Shewanella salipaludis]
MTVGAGPMPVDVVTASWQGYAVDEAEQGYYLALLERVFPAEDWTLRVHFLPFARTLYMLDRQRADIVLSVYRGDLGSGLYSEDWVEVEAIDAAVAPGLAANWQGVASLKAKKVRAMKGYRYDSLTKIAMDYQEGSSLLDMLNLLNAGSIDAVLDYRVEIRRLSRQLKRPQAYVLIPDVLRAEVYFGFADNAKGRMLKAHFDLQHKALIASGERAALFDAWQQKLSQRLAVEQN